MSRKEPRQEKPARGASATTISWQALFHAWVSHHRESARDSLTRQRRAPLQHILTALVIGITLALPTLFMLAIDNLQQLGQRWDGAPQLSLFLQREATAEDISQLETTIRQHPATAGIKVITPAEGLASLEKSAGLSGTMELLEENPLPPVITVQLRDDTSADVVQALLIDWQKLPRVEVAQADLAWVQKLFHMMQLGQRITIALAALLGFGALLSVGNTIRLAIENRRAEIVVAKLVGATDAFVRRPFLYSGFWFGFSGGLVSVALVAAGYHTIIGPASALATLYGSDFTLQGMDISMAAGLLLVGIVLGMLGAWLAVGQHLHDMRPR